MKELINNIAKGREYCDDAFKVMHDAIRDIIVKAGGYINTKAREQMLNNGIEDYLCGDNGEYEEDAECPFGTFKEDK